MPNLADTGRVIAGRYRLEAPIGRGAMGVVWRARDRLLDRDVAVKEVQIAETLTDAERANAYQRTLREAKTAARLNHPGVVTVYDVAEDEGRPWIVMQLVDAESLDQMLATSGPLPPRRAAEMGRQLLSALSVAHAAGVMHRDVKPSNVLLGRDDRAVLTDFGIATFLGDARLTQTGMVMGSPGFTAPERIRGEDATPASDLWSLGATLFAAVEGYGPYDRRGGAVTTMSAIINEDAPLAANAGALAPVIAALLRREPSERPDTATAARMISDVLPLLPARTGSAPPGYAATEESASPLPGSPLPGPAQPRTPGPGPARPGETSLDFAAPGQTVSGGPAGSASAYADTDGDQLSASQTAPTKPQPVMGGASPYDQPGQRDQPGHRDQPGQRDQPAQHDQPAQYEPTRYEQPRGSKGQEGPPAGPASESPPGYSGYDPPRPPPDFSSWYGPSPRSGPAPPARPWPGAAYQPGPAAPPDSGPAPRSGPAAPPGARPDYQPGVRRRRRPGLWWKIALVVLALLGASAGAATIVLLRHSTTGTPSGGPSSSSSLSSTGTLPPASLQIVDAVNEPRTGSLPAGWAAFTHQASNGESAGFTIASPANWTSSISGDQTYLKDPAANANILIDLTAHTFPNDMLAEARYVKMRSLAHFPGYAQLGLARTQIRNTTGAYWKFTWTDAGVQQEAIDLLFVLQTPAGPQSYALYMTAPASAWVQMRPIFDEEVETFAPLP